MERSSFRKICSLLVMISIISSCLKSDIPTTRKSFQSAPPGDGFEEPESPVEISLPPKVEVRHLIEPNLSSDLNYSSGTGHAGGGSYVRKLTIPKNFQGRIYVAGINVATLTNRHVKVRFRFGVGREAVTIPATIAKAPGITPSTNIHVLVLDLRSEPFRSIRLPYDLFDYNEYNFNAGEKPVQDNRNSGLYCRGLRLEDDPTFSGVGRCDSDDEQCLYAYAKVLDQGLVKFVNGVPVPTTPAHPQTRSLSGNEGYYQDYLDQQLLKPLLDNRPSGSYIFSRQSSTVGSIDLSFPDPRNSNAFITVNNERYYYRGPYRLVNPENWHFNQMLEGDVGQGRLFRRGAFLDSNDGMLRYYYQSYLFPLATQMKLGTGVAHLSSSTIQGPRTENWLSAPGDTLWMDGANARANSRNFDKEHLGSCNVSATIEIIAKDDNGNEFIISLAKDVKLQLVRPSQYRTDIGDEVLYTNFKSCNTNAACGSNECCFNSRCWDQNLVSQCFDNSGINGNRNIGESCTTDLQCSSLCCNRTSGSCAPHNTLLNPPVLCSKPQGDFCITKEWCQKEPVTKCLIVKTGTDPLGNTTCRQQCYTTLENGDCNKGICVPPDQSPPAYFDPNDPEACDNAVPAPRF